MIVMKGEIIGVSAIFSKNSSGQNHIKHHNSPLLYEGNHITVLLIYKLIHHVCCDIHWQQSIVKGFLINSLWPSDAIWQQGSGSILARVMNGLLPDDTKPVSEPMLTDHQWSPVKFMIGQFHKRCLNHQSLKNVWKITCLKFHSNFLRANELTGD